MSDNQLSWSKQEPVPQLEFPARRFSSFTQVSNSERAKLHLSSKSETFRFTRQTIWMLCCWRRVFLFDPWKKSGVFDWNQTCAHQGPWNNGQKSSQRWFLSGIFDQLVHVLRVSKREDKNLRNLHRQDKSAATRKIYKPRPSRSKLAYGSQAHSFVAESKQGDAISNKILDTASKRSAIHMGLADSRNTNGVSLASLVVPRFPTVSQAPRCLALQKVWTLLLWDIEVGISFLKQWLKLLLPLVTTKMSHSIPLPLGVLLLNEVVEQMGCNFLQTLWLPTALMSSVHPNS